VVCPACARWNLSPIEERWEAVEAAEKLFRDARMRVHTENIGLARLPDGTRLVRVGEAVAGELAAWRYGTQLLRRRKKYLVAGGISAAASIALFGGISAMGGGLLSFMFANRFLERRRAQKIVHRVHSDDVPTGHGLIIRRFHIAGMSLHPTLLGGGIEVHIRDAHREKAGFSDTVNPGSKDVVALSGESARTLLSRAMIHVNSKGASRSSLENANRVLLDAGSANAVLSLAAAGGAALGQQAGRNPQVLKRHNALAFEMALNEESERRALEGELAALTIAWQEAEEIAAIADALPGVATINRMLDRLSR
jgi:hypothetical protein